jgi:hypothetical protein
MHMDGSSINVDEYYDGNGSFTGTFKQTGSADIRQYTYLFGPELSHRSKNFRPFAHVLFGFTQVDVHKLAVTETWMNDYPPNTNFDNSTVYAFRGSFKSTSFSMAMGGGLDITINKRISLRLPQLDYIFPIALRDIHGTLTQKRYFFDTVPPPPLGSITPDETFKNTLRGTIDRFNNIRMSAGLVFKLD